MADIYDVNAAIQKPNIVNALREGQQYGIRLREQQRQMSDQNRLRELAPQIISGDQTAFAQGAAISPEAAGQYQQAGDSQLRRLKGAVDYFDKGLATGDDRIIQARFREISPYLAKLTGRPSPEAYTPDMLPAFEQVKTKIAMADLDPNKAELAPRVVGSALVDSTGRVLYQAPPEQEYQWSERAGAWIPKPGANAPQQGQQKTFEDGTAVPPPSMAGNDGMPVTIDPGMSAEDIKAVQAMEGGAIPRQFNAQETQMQSGLAAIPVAGIGPKPDISPAEERRLQLAEEAAQRAREAADRQRFGNAPAGFRFKADGTLEAIPGGPKPAGSAATEGERKAATLLQRLNFSLGQLQSAVQEDPAAASPSLAAEGLRRLPLVGEPVANAVTSQERQRVESAQLDILDAALTLGTGAAYTREQLEGYRRSYFPQIGDSPAAIRDKAARLQNVIEAAKIAAGRAAPQAEQTPSGPRRLKFNPATGKLE